MVEMRALSPEVDGVRSRRQAHKKGAGVSGSWGDSAMGAAGAAGITAAFECYGEELHSWLLARYGRHLTCDDLVQETFARLVREVAAGRTPDQVRPWLYRVAHNLAVSELRRPRPSVDDDRRIEPRRPTAGSAEAEYLGSLVSLELRRALAGLSPASRMSLLMAADGHPGHEIARAVGRSEQATRTLLCRARRVLREALGSSPGEPPA